MTVCPVCQFSYPPAESAGVCPRCALAGALAAAAPPLPSGDFEFIAELGRGGMGTVSLVRQRSLDRLVALKVIATGADAGAGARLLREARTAAALQHPHVVAVHEIGQDARGAFIAMEYCDGGDLRERLRRGPLPPRDAARLVAQLADAVACAHAAGVLHRDLKPSNVLLTAAGEPKLADFGLSGSAAKSEFTRTGTLAGSPTYLAPELTGPTPVVSAAIDVYGLGAILYECLTGRPPFTADSVAAVLAQIATHEPAAPRLLNPAVPADLDTIALLCLQKAPAARLPSAAALRDDLRRFLAGQPIHARPPSPLERVGRWARRNPALAAALGVIVAGTVAAFVVLREHNQRLEAAVAVAERERTTAREALRDSLLAQAHSRRESGRAGLRAETLALVRRAAALDPADPRLATEALAALAHEDWTWGDECTLPQLRARHTVDFDATATRAVVPDEAGTGVLVVAIAGGAVQRRMPDAGLGEIDRTIAGPGGWIAAVGRQRGLAVWAPDGEAPRWQLPGAGFTHNRALAFAPDASAWWYNDAQHRLVRHDARTGAETFLGDAGSEVWGLAVSPDGTQLAVAREEQFEVWDLVGGRRRWSTPGDSGIADPAWSADSRRVAAESFDGSPRVVVWDAQDGSALCSTQLGNKRSRALALHPDDRRLLAVDSEGMAHLVELVSGRVLLREQAGTHGLRISADGRTVALARRYQTVGTLAFAPLDVARPLTFLHPSNGYWRGSAVSPNGRWLQGLHRSSIISIDTTTGREVARTPITSGDTKLMQYLEDGRLMVSSPPLGVLAYGPGSASVPLGEPQIIAPPGGDLAIEVAANGRWWITDRAGQPGVRVWSGGLSGEPVGLASPGPNASAKISPAGTHFVLTQPGSRSASLHRLPPSGPPVELPVEASALGRFSVDGRWLALGTDRGFDLWDLRSPGSRATRLDVRVSGAFYGYSTFSPDGGRFCYLVDTGAVAFSRPGVWQPDFILTLPYGVQRDEWAWAPDGRTLYVLSGRNEGYALDPGAAERALRELGLATPTPPAK